jgi:hypothetical protein
LPSPTASLDRTLTRPSPYLFQVFSTSDAPEQGYYRLLHDFEDARSLRLVLELLETRRLDAEDVAAWPPLAELGRALRLAKRLEAWAVYKLLAGCVQSKLLWQNWGRQALDVLRLAGQAGDDILARFAVEAMQRQSDSNLAATSWSPTEATDAQHLPAMLWYPGTWTPDEFDDMPRAYVYALLRAAVPAAVGYEDKANVFGQRSLGEAFAHILAIYRRELLRHKALPLNLTLPERETTDRVAPSHTQPLPESPPVTLT